MKIVDFSKPQLDILERSLSPSHFVGFLTAGAMLALADTPDFDREMLNRLTYERTDFVGRQKRLGEPTGLPVAPVYWTDLHPEPMDSLRDVMGQCEHGCVHMLNSTAEPHARWFVILGGGDDDDVTEFFDSLGRAEKYLENTLEDQRVRHDEAIADVKRLYRSGTATDVDEAERIMEDFSLAYSTHRDDPGHVVIEGERIKIGGGEEPEAKPSVSMNVVGDFQSSIEKARDDITGLVQSDVPPGLAVPCVDKAAPTEEELTARYERTAAIEKVKAYLRTNSPRSAHIMATEFGLTFSWDAEKPTVAIIDGERFDCFQYNVCDPDRPDFQEAMRRNRHMPGLSRGAAIESVKAHLRVGQDQDARMMCEARGIPITLHPEQGLAYIDGKPFDIPRVVPRMSEGLRELVSDAVAEIRHFQGDEAPAEFKGPEKIGREAAQPSPKPVTIVAVDLCGNTGVTLRLSDGTTKSYKLADGPAGVKSVWIDDKQVVSEGRELKAAIIDRIKARLRAGECGMAENMARHAGIGFEWTPVPFEASIDGQTFNFSGTPHGL